MTEKMKKCSMCKINKLLKDFCNHKGEVLGKSCYCRSCTSLRYKKWAKNNPEKAKEWSSKWRLNNPEKVSLALKKSREKRLATQPHTRLLANMRSALYYTLKNIKKPRKTWDIFDFTFQELKLHLESQFTEGMSWDNYGLWHCDHLIPIDFFKFQSCDDVEFKMCWRLENLQPLWAVDNLEKSNKIVNAA